MHVCMLSCIWFFATPWTVAHQTPLSMEFSRQEYWSVLPFAPPGDLPDPGIEPMTPASPALAGRVFTTASPGLGFKLRCVWFWSSGLLHYFTKAEEPEIKLPTSVGSSKSKGVPEKHLFLFYWLCQSLWLCGSQQTVENSPEDGNSRPPYLPPEKSVCRSRSNS